VKQILSLALGILAAIGGFVDIGDLVFSSQAGAHFGPALLWALVVGVVGIGVYSEMCGRVAAASKRGVFDLIRERLGFGPGLVTLVAGQLVNLLTLAAEIGGVAIALSLLTGPSYRVLVPVAAVALALVIWLLPFSVTERVFSYAGLGLVIFVVVAVRQGLPLGAMAHGLVPGFGSSSMTLGMYFAVGIIGSAMMPYEVYFYSSGAVEEGWSAGSMVENRINAIAGFGIGSLLSAAIMIASAQLFQPRGIVPDFLASPALAPALDFGSAGLLICLIGILFATGGAAIETCMAGAYNIAQFLGWPWGKLHRPAVAARFSIAWLLMLGGAALILLLGINPISLTEVAVIFSVVVLPLTYIPILIVANDSSYMGALRNGRFANILGGAYLVVIVVVAAAALPLYILTSGGSSG
jgi:manganese transport protein